MCSHYCLTLLRELCFLGAFVSDWCNNTFNKVEKHSDLHFFRIWRHQVANCSKQHTTVSDNKDTFPEQRYIGESYCLIVNGV